DGPAAARQHRHDLVLHAEPHPAEVHADYAVPLLLGVLGSRRERAADAGVVHGGVELPEGRDGGLDEVADVLASRGVVVDVTGLAVGHLDWAGGLLAALGGAGEVGDDDAGAGLGEVEGAGAPDAGGGAGDEGDAAVEAGVHGRRGSGGKGVPI